MKLKFCTVVVHINKDIFFAEFHSCECSQDDILSNVAAKLSIYCILGNLENTELNLVDFIFV